MLEKLIPWDYILCHASVILVFAECSELKGLSESEWVLSNSLKVTELQETSVKSSQTDAMEQWTVSEDWNVCWKWYWNEIELLLRKPVVHVHISVPVARKKHLGRFSWSSSMWVHLDLNLNWGTRVKINCPRVTQPLKSLIVWRMAVWVVKGPWWSDVNL